LASADSATKDVVQREAQRPDLVYLCDWLPPDFGAVGQYSLHFARERVRAGRSVALYGLSSTASTVTVETHPGASLKIVRIAVPPYDKTSFRARALWTVRTDVRLLLSAWRDVRQSSEVLFTGSPPFLLHLVAPLNILLRKRLTYRITDFFPECLMAEYAKPPAPLRWLHRLTVFWRKRITQFEALGEDQRRRLTELGIDDRRILLRRDPSPVSISPRTQPLAKPDALAGKKILLYSGNFGVAHDHETFLNAYERHHREGSGRVALWLNAAGARANMLADALTEKALPFVRTQPVALESLAALLVTPDAHLITLRDGFVGFVLPSKVYGCMESGKDIVFIGPRASDVHLLCSRNTAGGRYRQCDVGDVGGVYAALEAIGAAQEQRQLVRQQ
jgi:hypothetical protein